MDKKKLIIIGGIVFVILIAIVVTIVILNINKNEPINENNNVLNQDIKVTGKLKEYIKNLTNEYYIKYSGKFRNDSGEPTEAIVEYTKIGENFALKSKELNMHIVCEKETLYNIVNRYEMIVEMDRKNFDINEYNLASDFGQIFVKSYKEKLNNTECDVEEYVLNSNTIKYYFVGNDIRLIRYKNQDIKIIRVEPKVNSTLLVKPEGYTNVVT